MLGAKVLNFQQITTKFADGFHAPMAVYAGCKGTKFLANHNCNRADSGESCAVYAGCKGTKFLANHNATSTVLRRVVAVYAGCKGTKFLANHNRCL